MEFQIMQIILTMVILMDVNMAQHNRVSANSCQMGVSISSCPDGCLCCFIRPCMLNVQCLSKPMRIDVLNPLLSDDVCTSFIHVHPHTDVVDLSKSTRLTQLTLRIPNLQTLPSSICTLGSLKKLDVEHCNLTKIPTCITNLTSLEVISASKNDIHHVAKNTFKGMTNLQKVTLAYNEMVTIDPMAFGFIKELKQLVLVDLSHNNLTTIDAFIPSTNNSLFNGSNNNISNITNEQGFSYTCGQNWMKNSIIDMSNNNFTVLGPIFKFFDLKALKVFCMHGDNILMFMNNEPFDCGCGNYQLIVLLQFFLGFMDRGLTCASPPELKGKWLDLVDLNAIMCEMSSGCPENANCIYFPHRRSIRVVIHNKTMTALPRELPPPLPDRLFDTYYLQMNHCGLTEITDWPYWHNTSSIDFSYNNIKKIDPNAWHTILTAQPKHVFLNNNSLTHLPHDSVDINFHGTEMRLHGNPWSCDCHNMWMGNWLKKMENMQVLNKDHVLYCESPPQYKGEPVQLVMNQLIIKCK